MSAFKPDTARLRDAAQALLEKHHLPGIGIGVVQGGELAFAEGYGHADIVLGKPYTPESRQRIGSITKTMVSLCLMALVDEGRFSLDSRVAELLPDIEFKNHADKLTVRYLLTHTGGLGEAPNAEDLKKPFDLLFYETDPDIPLAELYTDGITIEAEPGTKYAYANHGFALLGEIVSRAEKAPLADAMQRRVFGPLGMTESDLIDRPHQDLSRGYSQAATPQDRALLDLLGVQLESDDPVDGHNLPGKFVRVWGNGGAGAVQSTVTDMCRYAAALLRGTHGIVNTATFAAMTADQWRPDKRLPGWGLGFGVRGGGKQRRFGHGGSVFGGWNSFLTVYPELDAALIVHMNLFSDAFDRLVTPPLVDAFLGASDQLPAALAIDPRVLATAPGVYELTMPGPLTNFRPQFNCGRVQISNQGGVLVMHSRRGPWKGGARLLPVRADEPDFCAIDAPGDPVTYMALLLDGEGAVTGLRFPQIVDMHRNPDVQPWT
jgi:CubicO group peptidase (beta-lactamase class C family)